MQSKSFPWAKWVHVHFIDLPQDIQNKLSSLCLLCSTVGVVYCSLGRGEDCITSKLVNKHEVAISGPEI